MPFVLPADSNAPSAVPSSATVDPYGTDLALDATGDLRVTPSGSLGAVSGPLNCAQAMFLRLNTSPGELALHPAYGSQLARRLVGAKMNVSGLVRQLNAELQALLAEDARFAAAQVSDVQHPANTGQANSVQLGVQTRLSGGERVTLDNVNDPSPSDVSLPQIVDPTIDPLLAFDPAVEQEFFADQSELDTLNNLNTQQAMANDIPGASILLPGGD